VSKLLEGETLRERLRSGAIAMRKTLEYAFEISPGLAAADKNFGVDLRAISAGVESVGAPHFSADGNAFAYVYQRVLPEAFAVTGLK
jgi:hypothetical protein